MTPNEKVIRDELCAEGINPDFKVNYLVEAGAGAGKTYTMIQRITNQLVSGDCPPEKLVAITFTKKSTQEMKERLDKELAERRKNATDPAQIARLEELIRAAGQMQISTIHSFCQTMLESMPFQSPLGVNMKVQQNDTAECKAFFRRKYWENPAVFDLVTDDYGVRYKELENTFYNLCQNNEAEIVYDSLQSAEYREALTALNIHATSLHKELYDLMKTMGNDWEFVKDEVAELLQLSESDFVKDPQNMVALGRIRNRNGSAPPLQGYDGEAKRIREILSMKAPDFAKAKQDDPAYFQAHPILELWSKVKNTWSGKSSKSAKSNQCLKDAVARIVHSHVMDAMVPLVEEYRAEKTANGNATFNDLLLRIRDMLRDNKEARDYFHNRYQVLYVDEFQDTDPVQAEMLFYLTGDPATIDTMDWRNCKPVPGSLFLVGDPKQAIYRFRGADIDVYTTVKTAFEQGCGEVRKLQHNFRSSEAVCAWTEKLFKPPAQLDKDTAPIFFSPKDGVFHNPKQAQYEDMIAEQGKVDGSYLFSYEAIKGKETDPEQVAAFIRTMVDKGVKVPDKNGGHAAEWKDFLILTPKKPMIKEYVRALAAMDIPMNVAGEQKLLEVEAIRRAVLHLRSMLENQDDMALIQVLTDCYQIPLKDMRLLLQRTDRYSLREVLWKTDTSLAVKKTLEAETPQNSALLHLCDVMYELAELREMTRKLPAMSVIERLMDDGYGIWNTELDLHQRKQEYGRVQQYLDAVRSGPQHSFPALAAHAIACAEGSAEYELALQEEKNQVQIMNLHKSKGLEGNIVILTDGTIPKFVQRHVSRDPHAREYACIEAERSMIGWPKDWNGEELLTKQKDNPKRICKKREESEYLDAERLRLLYVAVTRAAYWLVVCAKPPKVEKGRRSGETAWQKISDHTGFPNAKSIEDNTTDAALKAALESLRTGKHQYQKTDRKTIPATEVSLEKLREEREKALASCDDMSAYNISPSKLDYESRTVKRRQEKVDDETADQKKVDDEAVKQTKDTAMIVVPAAKEPHGADWGTIMHRIMELAVRKQKFDTATLQALAVQAVSETLGDDILTKTQKSMLLAGVDMESEKALKWIAKKAAAAAAFLTDPNTPLHRLIDDGVCYPELPFMVRESDLNSELYQHLASHISDEKAKDKMLDIEGVIDLAVHHKDGSWTVVDYKTDKFRKNETSDELKHRLTEEYTAQILSYVKILESMGKGKVKGAYLCSIPMKGELISLSLDGKIAPLKPKKADAPAKKANAGYAADSLKQGRHYGKELFASEGMNRFSLLLDGKPVVLRNKKGELVTEVEKCAPFTFAVGDWMKQQYPNKTVVIDDRNAGNVVRIKRLLKVMHQVLPAEVWQKISIAWRKEE